MTLAHSACLPPLTGCRFTVIPLQLLGIYDGGLNKDKTGKHIDLSALGLDKLIDAMEDPNNPVLDTMQPVFVLQKPLL